MKSILILCVVGCVLMSCAEEKTVQNVKKGLMYSKQEKYITMRDGVELHTTIYQPIDDSKTYPILMKRTPYSCRPYGKEDKETLNGHITNKKATRHIMNNPYLVESGYIFVCQDVRGRWMSHGDYTTMTPNEDDESKVDESSDAYDTIEWLLENVDRHNGKVGQWGISYPGFYTVAALPNAHPALTASAPQAPISDFFFDDFHHNGAYFLSYWYVTALFGYQSDEPSKTPWYQFPDVGTKDAYRFYLDELTPLSKSDKYFGEDNFFWKELVDHPNYDEFWQKRNILPHLKNIDHAVLTVGGWFDAEDLYGPLNIYKTIEKHNSRAQNRIIMGPWGHGDWHRVMGVQRVGDVSFGKGLTEYYQQNVEFPFFEYYLKDKGDMNLPEAQMYDTGDKTWREFNAWPPNDAQDGYLYICDNERLAIDESCDNNQTYTSYISNPKKPVPYTEKIRFPFVPRHYMGEDQRFASRRNDVLSFETAPLEENVTLGGEMEIELYVSTTGTDADWVVKLIDVYPASVEENEDDIEGVELDYFELMVRSEVIRGRFRESFSNPKPFESGQVTKVSFRLQDVLHTFKKGHRVKIHIQSTWFPLIDINPQKYVENIFKAKIGDFQSAEHRVYHSNTYPSRLKVQRLD